MHDIKVFFEPLILPGYNYVNDLFSRSLLFACCIIFRCITLFYQIVNDSITKGRKVQL